MCLCRKGWRGFPQEKYFYELVLFSFMSVVVIQNPSGETHIKVDHTQKDVFN
jgi:hypothetical protein